jgi:hypothetical protein
MDNNRIPLPVVASELRAMGADPVPPYRIFLTAILDARIPATRVTGRWYVERKDLPQIAETLGIALPKPGPTRLRSAG